MIFNQLNLLPTQETLDYLSSIMSGSPIDLDLSAYKVELMTSLEPIAPMPERIYDATAYSVKVWYDAYLQRSSLILSLVSSDLQRRAMELNEQGVVREFHNYYNPHLVLKPDYPPLSRNFKNFVTQTANVLCANERPLQFTSEWVAQIELLAPPDFEYNEAMAAERDVRRGT